MADQPPDDMELVDEEGRPVDFPVGNSIVPYQDEHVRVRVIRISETEFLTVYERPETGHNLLVLRFDSEEQSTTFELGEFEPNFWNLTVDGEERPSVEIGEILEEMNISGTEIDRENRTIALQTGE